MLFLAFLIIIGFPLHVHAMEIIKFATATSREVIIAQSRGELENHSFKLITILGQLNDNTDIILAEFIPQYYEDYLHHEKQAYSEIIQCIQQNLWDTYITIPVLVGIEANQIKHIEQLQNYGLISEGISDKRKQLFADLILLKKNTKQTCAQLKPLTKQWMKMYFPE